MNKDRLYQMIEELESMEYLSKLFHKYWLKRLLGEMGTEKTRAYITVFSDVFPQIEYVLKFVRRSAPILNQLQEKMPAMKGLKAKAQLSQEMEAIWPLLLRIETEAGMFFGEFEGGKAEEEIPEAVSEEVLEIPRFLEEEEEIALVDEGAEEERAVASDVSKEEEIDAIIAEEISEEKIDTTLEEEAKELTDLIEVPSQEEVDEFFQTEGSLGEDEERDQTEEEIPGVEGAEDMVEALLRESEEAEEDEVNAVLEEGQEGGVGTEEEMLEEEALLKELETEEGPEEEVLATSMEARTPEEEETEHEGQVEGEEEEAIFNQEDLDALFKEEAEESEQDATTEEEQGKRKSKDKGEGLEIDQDEIDALFG